MILSAPNSESIEGEIILPASKSISNRALIIRALSKEKIVLDNLSEAEDTKILSSLLMNKSLRKNAGMAGTAFRFMCAFLAVQPGEYLLTGADRMKKRPIKELVEPLKKLGAKIDYLEKDGFPPLKINGGDIKGGQVEIKADVSSQFISALLLVAPTLAKGLTLKLIGEVSSRPYIELTLATMREFGIESTWKNDTISVQKQNYKSASLTIEGDWSAASYYYSILAIADEGSITLGPLSLDTFQGDSIVADIYYRLGIITEHVEDQVVLSKSENVIDFLEYDFSDCPDLAQTVICTCAALGIQGEFSGLSSLKIKETDRIKALQNELQKFNWQLTEMDGSYSLMRGESAVSVNPIKIECYNDHRMAM